jgi:hypothetical protein
MSYFRQVTTSTNLQPVIFLPLHPSLFTPHPDQQIEYPTIPPPPVPSVSTPSAASACLPAHITPALSCPLSRIHTPQTESPRVGTGLCALFRDPPALVPRRITRDYLIASQAPLRTDVPFRHQAGLVGTAGECGRGLPGFSTGKIKISDMRVGLLDGSVKHLLRTRHLGAYTSLDSPCFHFPRLGQKPSFGRI